MDLRIEIGHGQLGIRYPKNELNLRVPSPDLRIRQIPAQLDLNRDQVQFSIDYKPTWQSIGIYDFVALEKQSARQGMAVSLEGTSRRAVEGDQLGKIENKQVKVLELAWQSSLPRVKELTIDALRPPEISVNIEETQGGFVPARVQVNSQPALVRTQAKVGLLDIYLEKEPYTKIETVGGLVDMTA